MYMNGSQFVLLQQDQNWQIKTIDMARELVLQTHTLQPYSGPSIEELKLGYMDAIVSDGKLYSLFRSKQEKVVSVVVMI
jgi:hypothetical protein